MTPLLIILCWLPAHYEYKKLQCDYSLTLPCSPPHSPSSKHTGPLQFLEHNRHTPASRKLAIPSPWVVPHPDIFEPCSHTSFKYLISRTSNTSNKIAIHPLLPHAVQPLHPALFCSLSFGSSYTSLSVSLLSIVHQEKGRPLSLPLCPQPLRDCVAHAGT